MLKTLDVGNTSKRKYEFSVETQDVKRTKFHDITNVVPRKDVLGPVSFPHPEVSN